MKKRNGFTLVEILIVVVILGILAAIVIPQFSSASDDAKVSTLVSDLQTIRSQIQLYKLQHNGSFVGLTADGAAFASAMTGYTKIDGTTGTAGAAGVYGPYLQSMPKNPFNDSATVTLNGTPGSGGLTSGWMFNTTTGAFNADDALSSNSVTHASM